MSGRQPGPGDDQKQTYALTTPPNSSFVTASVIFATASTARLTLVELKQNSTDPFRPELSKPGRFEGERSAIALT